jgi:hypothetical protein
MNESASSCEGDFVTIATCETPTETHLLKETLLASGLAARVADANFLQANPWMSNAAGGVRVLVPASLASEAKKTIEALDAGAFQIEGDHGAAGIADPDEVTPTQSNLRTFHLYTHSKRRPTVVAVKQGFSWSAFVVGPLWFLFNGMWLTFALSAMFIWGAPLVIRSFDDPASSSASGLQLLVAAVFLSVWVFSGLIANFLLGEELKRKGYAAGPAVHARSAGEAINAMRRKPSP